MAMLIGGAIRNALIFRTILILCEGSRSHSRVGISVTKKVARSKDE